MVYQGLQEMMFVPVLKLRMKWPGCQVWICSTKQVTLWVATVSQLLRSCYYAKSWDRLNQLLISTDCESNDM